MRNNQIIYDYLTFSSKIHSHLGMIELLGLQNVRFELLPGRYNYHDRLYFEGISINYNGRADMGICVEMSGQGCRTWEKYGNSDYDMIFSEIVQNYSDEADKRQMNITRLDVAYDDFTGLLDLPLLCRETQLLNFVSRFEDWDVHTGNKGISVNHGSPASRVYIRIYDKKLEQERKHKLDLSDVPHWVRCELQLRKECALGFIRLPDIIDKNYFVVLNRYLRYIVPTDNQTNKSMLDTAPYWLQFIDSFSAESIFYKPATNYSFDKLYGFVNNQLSGAISTYIDIVGVEQFLKDIHNSRKGKKLNSKYTALKEQCEANTNNILAFLAEKGEKI